MGTARITIFRIISATTVVLAVAACKSKGGRSDTAGGTNARAVGGAEQVAMRKFDGDPKVAQEGRKLFLEYNCYGCHGGLAGGAMGPSLRDTVWKYGGSDQQIMASIHDGRPMGMPTWGKTLTADQIKTLVTYIRSLRTDAEPKFFFASQMAAAGVDTASGRTQ